MRLLDLIFGKKEMDVTGNTSSVNNVSSQPVNISGDFEFCVEDVFAITGRGTVVTGKVSRGSIKINDEVVITRTGMRTTVVGIEQFRKSMDYVQEGDNCGILLRNVSRDDIGRGDILVK